MSKKPVKPIAVNKTTGKKAEKEMTKMEREAKAEKKGRGCK